MKKLVLALIAVPFFMACNPTTQHSESSDVNRDSVQVKSGDSLITKPATHDTSDKALGRDSSNPNNQH